MINKIFITDYIVKQILKKNFCKSLSKKIKMQRFFGGNEIINENYLKQFPNLKAIVRYGVDLIKLIRKMLKEN